MKDWKTTLVGIATGIGYLFLQGLSQGLKPKDALLAAGLGLLGTLSQDSKK